MLEELSAWTFRREIISSLHKMRYGALARRRSYRSCIPAYRSDILHTCDLLEDIAIAYGFDRITPELPQTSTTGRSHPVSKLRIRSMK